MRHLSKILGLAQADRLAAAVRLEDSLAEMSGGPNINRSLGSVAAMLRASSGQLASISTDDLEAAAVRLCDTMVEWPAARADNQAFDRVRRALLNAAR